MKTLNRVITIFALTLPLVSYSAEKKILIIESYHAEYAWDQAYTQAIEKELGDIARFYHFEMDTKRRHQLDHPYQAHLALRFYHDVKPDLVFLGDDNALKYLGPKLAKTKTPVVYLGINNNPRAYIDAETPNITGVLERPLLKHSVKMIRNILREKAPKILVLLDDGVTSKIIKEDLSQALSQEKSFDVTIENVGRWQDWQTLVNESKKNGYDAIVVGLYQTLRDTNDAHVPDTKVMAETNRNSPVPIFGFWSFSIGKDQAVGGFVLDGGVQGQAAAKIARKILETGEIDLIPDTPAKGRFIFSRSEVKKWGLTIPPGIEARTDWVD